MRKRVNKKFVLFGLIVLILSGFLFSPYVMAGGLKKIVAVSRFENRTSSDSGGQYEIGDGISDQLTDALIQSGQFVVLERQTLTDVISEGDLAASGRFQESKSAMTGKLTSAQILVKGTITEFESKSSGSGAGIDVGRFRIGGKKGEAHVGVIIRLIDTTTGEVLDSKRVEGKAKSGGINFSIDIDGIDFDSESFKKTPLGKATQIAIDTAVEFIASSIEELPFQGSIIKATEKGIYINAGDKTGASIGDVFTVYSVGEELVDPVTGELLGVEEEEIGTIKICEIKEKYSKCEIINTPTGSIKTGDIIRSD